jgi:hypothetical protein
MSRANAQFSLPPGDRDAARAPAPTTPPPVALTTGAELCLEAIAVTILAAPAACRELGVLTEARERGDTAATREAARKLAQTLAGTSLAPLARRLAAGFGALASDARSRRL